MKFAKYLTAVLAGGMLLTSCGEDFFNDMDSTTATNEQIENEGKKDPQKVLASQLNGCYTNWNLFSPSGLGEDINAHIEAGFGGIMTVADVMSNNQSHILGTGDPFQYDHVLDYNAQMHIRARWYWSFFYTIIKSANDVISVIDEASASSVQKQYLGQALAFRGISYAYLAQYYQMTYKGNEDKLCVPILLTSKESEKEVKGRATVAQVYAQATSDLEKAVQCLQGYKHGNDKTTIDENVAEGFLARVYLVMNEWDKAAAMAHAARQGYELNDINLAQTWNYQDASNQEVMWAFIPTDATKRYYASWASFNSYDGPGYGHIFPHVMDQALYNSIPDADVRKKLFFSPEEATDTYPALMCKKFPYVDQWLGNVVYMRVSEMYLIEAEAQLMAGHAQACADIMAEFMPNRVEGWTAPSSYTQMSIYKQRRIELYGEGFGYTDCLRLKQDLVRDYEGSNEAPALKKNIPHTSYKWIFQVPQNEIRDNDAISDADQNPAM